MLSRKELFKRYEERIEKGNLPDDDYDFQDMLEEYGDKKYHERF